MYNMLNTEFKVWSTQRTPSWYELTVTFPGNKELLISIEEDKNKQWYMCVSDPDSDGDQIIVSWHESPALAFGAAIAAISVVTL